MVQLATLETSFIEAKDAKRRLSWAIGAIRIMCGGRRWHISGMTPRCLGGSAGRQQRLQVLGHQVVQLLPVPPIASQLRTVIGMLTCADELVFGISADYDAAPDIDSVVRLRRKPIAVTK